MNSVTDMLTQTSDHYNSKKKVSRNWVTLTCSKEANSFLDKIKRPMERGVKIEKSINDFISKE